MTSTRKPSTQGLTHTEQQAYIRERCPAMLSRIQDGSAFVDASKLIGTASDGTEVILGGTYSAADIEGTESYLRAHPTPDTW